MCYTELMNYNLAKRVSELFVMSYSNELVIHLPV